MLGIGLDSRFIVLLVNGKRIQRKAVENNILINANTILHQRRNIATIVDHGSDILGYDRNRHQPVIIIRRICKKVFLLKILSTILQYQRSFF